MSERLSLRTDNWHELHITESWSILGANWVHIFGQGSWCPKYQTFSHQKASSFILTFLGSDQRALKTSVVLLHILKTNIWFKAGTKMLMKRSLPTSLQMSIDKNTQRIYYDCESSFLTYQHLFMDSSFSMTLFFCI